MSITNKKAIPLGDLSPEDFIKEYWQQKPLVIQQAFKNFKSPISAEELAGLACEEDVDSRVVIEKGGEHPWQCINGPMNENILASLPETHWTLLVNDVEKHCPKLANIVDAFRFIPEWRIDDLMISFAPEGGTVGPHLDQYDVFILQAQGTRRWQINTQEVADDNQVANTNLRIQKIFTAEQEWLLKAGDIIYIPPGVSHYGVAMNDCLSFSIGFRAPSHTEMLSDFIDFISHDLPKERTYKDRNLKLQQYSNEITASTIENIRDIFKEYLDPRHPAIAKWFGRFVSDTKTDLVFESEEQYRDFTKLQQDHPRLCRNPASRFAFTEQEIDALLFIDGENFSVRYPFAKILCEQRVFNLKDTLTEEEKEFVVSLYNAGQLITEY